MSLLIMTVPMPVTFSSLFRVEIIVLPEARVAEGYHRQSRGRGGGVPCCRWDIDFGKGALSRFAPTLQPEILCMEAHPGRCHWARLQQRPPPGGAAEISISATGTGIPQGSTEVVLHSEMLSASD